MTKEQVQVLIVRYKHSLSAPQSSEPSHFTEGFRSGWQLAHMCILGDLEQMLREEAGKPRSAGVGQARTKMFVTANM